MFLVTSHKLSYAIYDLCLLKFSKFKTFAAESHSTGRPCCTPVFLSLTALLTSFWKSHWPWEKSSPAVANIVNWIEEAQLYLEAVFELLGHKVEDYGIDAGVDFCHVHAEVVQN